MGDMASLGTLVDHLTGIREKYGDDAYRRACTDVARSLISQGGPSEKFAREAFKGTVDFKVLDQETSSVQASVGPATSEAPSGTQQDIMMKALASQVPNLRTQAQFNALMVLFDTVRAMADAIFASDASREAEARQAFDRAIDVAHKVTEISNQLRDVPEAATSAAAEEFKAAPKQFGEYDTHRTLMSELAQIQDAASLQEWYTQNRSKFDQVSSQSLRNTLFDAVRAKKNSFQGAAL